MTLSDLYFEEEGTVDLNDITFDAEGKEKIDQFIKEYSHAEALKQYNLPINNKLFFFGHTGCGKTMTAKALAKALGKKIIVVNLGAIVSSRLGETAKNITTLFKKVTRQGSILFLDEFDSLGKIRDYDDTDSSEMKRIVNTLIQLIDYLPDNAIIIAATNQSHVIDTALLRRFEIKIHFQLPHHQLLDSYYNHILDKYPAKFRNIKREYDISFAEAKVLAINAVKKQVIEEEEKKKAALININITN
ncbi:AAA family ATPase [Aquimarina hainanensis]|uniref:AAA family ATPase n=1 Tax=Aquimarina hainanensis TaxID=1578017 RepID=A0ABW5NBD8_9FLAO